MNNERRWICNASTGLLSRILIIGLLILNGLAVTLYLSVWRGINDVSSLDFVAFYAAGRLSPDDLYDLDQQREVQIAAFGHPYPIKSGVLPFSHPPLIVPILYLTIDNDPIASYSRWTLVLTISALLSAVVLYGILRDQGWGAETAFIASLTGLLFFPLFSSIVKGQDTAITLLFILLWARFLLRGQSILAGLSLGLALVKPHIPIALFLPLFALNTRAALWFTIAGAVLTIASVLFVGINGAAELIHLIRLSASSPDYGVSITQQYNLLGFMLWFGLPVEIARPIAWTAFLAIPAFLAWRFRGQVVSLEHIALMIGCATLFAPHLHNHDLALLILPLIVAAKWLHQRMCSMRFQPSAW